MSRESLIDYLGEYRRRGQDVAVAQRSGYRMERWTYRDVADLAAQCARELEARGIAPGDKVMLWGRNSAQWVAAFFGCILRGAVAVPMDQGATVDFVSLVAHQVDAKLLIVDQKSVRADPQAALVFEALRRL